MDMPFGFGGRTRPNDARDYDLGKAQPISPLPSVTRPEIFGTENPGCPVKYQGKFGTCGAHAGAMLDSILYTFRDAAPYDLSPKYLWKRIKQIDGFGLNDGTDMRSIFKALYKSGTCREGYCPNTLDATIEGYTDRSAITEKMDMDALPQTIPAYAFMDRPSFDQIKEQIWTHGAVLALVDIGDGWWANGWSEQAVCPLRVGNFVGRHFVVFYGYNEKYIYGVNSFGKDWGRTGHFYFDESYVKHVIEIGTAVANTKETSENISKLAQMVSSLKKALAFLLARKS